MSHFLRHLIARHRSTATGPGPGAVVQPRLKSRFEGEAASVPHEQPPPTTPGGATDTVAAATPPARRPPADRPSRADRVIFERAPDGEDSRAAREARAAAAPRQADAREPHDPARRRPDTPADSTASRQPVIPAPSRSGRADVRIETTLDEVGQAAGEAPTPAPRPRRRDNRSRLLDVPPDTAAPPPSDPQAPRADRPRVAEPAGEPERPSAAETGRLESGRRSADRSPPGTLRAPDWAAEVQAALQGRQGPSGPPREPEPTVNVTIGRIEIRAVPRPPRKGREARPAPAPVMTLDDYLTKRNGRRR